MHVSFAHRLLAFSLLLCACYQSPETARSSPTIYSTATLAVPNSTARPQPTPRPTATEVSLFINADRERLVSTFLQALVEDKRYDPSAGVLHKYVDDLQIYDTGTVLTFTLSREVDSDEELVGLAYDLMLVGAVVSKAGKDGDWELARIEFIWLGPASSSISFYVSGHSSILHIANGSTNIYDVMQTVVDKGQLVPEPTKPSATLPPQPICICSYNAYNCDGFNTQASAQSCFEYCLRTVGYDVHWLDADSDGLACEWNP